MLQQEIVGTWKLLSFHGRSSKGELRQAFGEGAQGLIVYTAEGYMSAALCAKDRPAFHSLDFRGGTPDEALMAVNSYISYCGRYTIDKDTIIHHVEMSLYPNWVGQDQKRNMKLTSAELVLSTPPFLLSGVEWTFELVWTRL